MSSTEEQEVANAESVEDLGVRQSDPTRVPWLVTHVEHECLTVSENHLVRAEHSDTQFRSLQSEYSMFGA